MSSDRLNVRVVSNQNSVELIKNENIVFVTDKKQDTSVNVTQKETAVVTVASKGPKGDKGDKGDTGDVGTVITNQITTGSITASVNIGTNTFSVQSGSSTFLFVSSSGNVGINTITPTVRLHISGASTDNLLRIGSPTNANILFVSGSGNIGIGTTTPSVRLHLSQSSGTFQRVDINNANADAVNATTEYYTNTGATPDLFGATSFRLQGGTTDAFKQFQVYIANLTSPRFIINGSGNVGIGTTTPVGTLHLYNAAAATRLAIDGDAGQNRLISYRTGALQRFGLYVNNTAENGSNAGSNFAIRAYSDAGTLLSTPFFINRATGNVGIGTTSPSAKLEIKGSGATSATTALRVENSSAAARLTILDDGTSAFNTSHLYVSSSGNVGIGTTNPQRRLHIDASGSANTSTPLLLTSVDSSNRVGILFASSSLSAGRQHSLFNRVNTPTVEWLLGTNAGETALWNFIPRDDTNYAITLRTPYNGGTAQITTGLSQSLFSLGAGGSSNQHLSISSSGNVGIGLTSPLARLHISGANALRMQNTGFDTFEWSFSAGTGIGFRNVTDGTTPFFVGGTDDIGVGTTNTSARLHISGASNSNLLRVGSPASDNILFVTGSGRVGVGTTTPRELLHVAGGNIALDGTRHIDFGSGNSRIIDLGLTAGQGYPITISTFGPIGTGTANNLTEKLRLTGSGSLGLGTNSPSARFHISGGFTDGNLMRVQSPTGAEYFFISASGNVGIGTSVPNAKLHISSNSGYQLRVAASASFSSSLMVSGSFGYVGIGVESPQSILHVNDRPEFNNVTGNVAATFAGNYQNITTFYNNNNQDNTVLGEPAAWMSIKCDGTEYLIPLYTS